MADCLQDQNDYVDAAEKAAELSVPSSGQMPSNNVQWAQPGRWSATIIQISVYHCPLVESIAVLRSGTILDAAAECAYTGIKD